MEKRQGVTPWRIHFFRRHKQNDPKISVPTLEFFETIPPKVAAEIHAVLDAVAEAPPPAFSGGGKWEAMKGSMAGFYEVRVQYHTNNYRLFCILDRDNKDLGGPSIVCIDGLTKPRRSAARDKDYKRALQLRSEFTKRRTIFQD